MSLRTQILREINCVFDGKVFRLCQIRGSNGSNRTEVKFTARIGRNSRLSRMVDISVHFTEHYLVLQKWRHFK